MAYNYYPPQYYGYQNQQTVATSNSGITWVQGEQAAKAYPVAAGQSVLLMDSEDSLMYIKSTDQSGMPQPLRVFEYKERTTSRTEAAVATSRTEDFISRKEFEEFKKDIQKTIKNMEEGEG